MAYCLYKAVFIIKYHSKLQTSALRRHEILAY